MFTRRAVFPAVLFLLPLAAAAAGERTALDPSYTMTNLDGSPARLALDGAGLLYMTNSWERAVLIVDQAGNRIGSFEPSQTACPLGVAVLPGGWLALSDAARGAVDLYDGNRAFVRSLGSGASEFTNPSDLAYDSITGRLYVADSGAREVRFFDLGGAALGSIGSEGSGPGQFVRPAGVALSPDGQTIYVSDQALDRVQFFGNDGTYLGVAGSRGSLPGQFVTMQGLAVSEHGGICVADAFHNTVEVMKESDGSFLAYLGEMSLEPGSGLLQPTDVALDEGTGRLFVASHNTSVIEVFDVSGVLPGPSDVLDWRLLDE